MAIDCALKFDYHREIFSLRISEIFVMYSPIYIQFTKLLGLQRLYEGMYKIIQNQL